MTDFKKNILNNTEFLKSLPINYSDTLDDGYTGNIKKFFINSKTSGLIYH